MYVFNSCVINKDNVNTVTFMKKQIYFRNIVNINLILLKIFNFVPV